VIEIKLTPNRPDCTGVHGIARDLAAADMGKLMALLKPQIAGRADMSEVSKLVKARLSGA